MWLNGYFTSSAVVTVICCCHRHLPPTSKSSAAAASSILSHPPPSAATVQVVHHRLLISVSHLPPSSTIAVAFVCCHRRLPPLSESSAAAASSVPSHPPPSAVAIQVVHHCLPICVSHPPLPSTIAIAFLCCHRRPSLLSELSAAATSSVPSHPPPSADAIQVVHHCLPICVSHPPLPSTIAFLCCHRRPSLLSELSTAAALSVRVIYLPPPLPSSSAVVFRHCPPLPSSSTAIIRHPPPSLSAAAVRHINIYMNFPVR